MKCVGNIKLVIFGIFCFIAFNFNVNATSSVSLKASATSVTVGDTITITTTFSSDVGLVWTKASVECRGAGVKESGKSIDKALTNDKTYQESYKIRPTSSGTITCTVSSAKILDMNSDQNLGNDAWINLSNKSLTIQVKEPVVITPQEYSSNNYLEELSIDGFELSPEFDKETLEYSVEVPNDTEKVIINAKKEDSTASVSGSGEVSVSEGANKIEVKVTAQNGNERVYVINVNVKELDPINVTVDDKEYTIIRKNDVLEPPQGYEETTVMIDGEEVLAYTNDQTKYTLVGLKDEEGNSAWYIYDEEKDTYTPYVFYNFNGVSLIILDMPKNLIPDGFVKSSFEYNDERVEGYKYKSNSQFYLIYGMNSETGEKGFYMFDKKEGTVQRFNDEIADIYKDKADLYFMILMIVSGIVGVAIVATAVVLIVRTKKRKKNKIKF